MNGGKSNIKKLFIIAILSFVFIFGIAFYAVSGKVFLDFIGNELHISLEYSNWVDFVSCFVIRHVRLDDPEIVVKDFHNAVIKADRAFLEPSFDRLFTEKGIQVTFIIENARLAAPIISPKDRGSDILRPFAQSAPPDLWGVLSEGAFDTVTTTIFMHGDTADFENFEAVSKNIKIIARGSASENGDVKISAHLLFSPELVGAMPEALKEKLTVSLSGWGKYDFKFEFESDEQGMRIESDRLRIEFKKVVSQ